MLLEEIAVEPLVTQLSNTQHKTAITQQLKASESIEREKLLISYFQEVISQVLWVSPSEIDVQQPLNRMGLDSLMALELRDRLQTDLAVNVPLVKFIEDICIVDLATEVNEQMNQIKNIQTIESENNEPTFLSDANNIDWVEGEL